MSLKIDSIEAKNFKCLSTIDIDINGNDLILSGTNGSGKSALLEFLELLCTGQIHGMKKSEILKKDIVRHGEKFAELKIRLRSGEHFKYLSSLKITPDKIKVELSEVGYTTENKEVLQPITRVSEFFNRVTAPYTIDPTSLRDMDSKQLVDLVYQLCPGLKEIIDTIDSSIVEIKNQRSKIKAKAEHLKELSAAIPGTLPEGYEARIDPIKISLELDAANKNNEHIDNLVTQINNIDSEMSFQKSKLDSVAAIEKQLQDEADAILKKLDEQSKNRNDIYSTLKKLAASKHDVQNEIDSTQRINTKEISDKLVKASEINKVFDSVDHKKELDQEVAHLRKSFSDKFQEMRDLEAERVKALQNAEDLPVKGLSIVDGSLYVPDRDNNNVRIDTLSDGQFYPIAAELHAALIKKDGLRLIFVRNLNAMDAPTLKKFIKVCSKHNLQIIGHETIRTSDSKRMGILLENGKAISKTK